MNNQIVPTGDDGFLLYQTVDGETRVEVRIASETVWLSLNQMADLFQRDKSVISRHIANVFEEGELVRASTVANFATVQHEGNRSVSRNVEYFNLDVIISVGYRVKSHRGTQFRIWATQRLREYIVKGFTMDDRRLKEAGSAAYFEELLGRIRDIRSSERVFWRKVLDIYATSIDYDAHNEATRQFFQTVQNKMHWAIHGKTAAEVIYDRADAGKPQMGLTGWAGNRPRKSDVGVAKNYLTEQEIKALNLIVSAYLDFAELQALNGRPMTMQNWITKLDDFVRLSEREVLTHAGKISHGKAITKANEQFELFHRSGDRQVEPVDLHFDEAVKEVKKLTRAKPPQKRAKKEGGSVADK
jgi:hypothetical protein